MTTAEHSPQESQPALISRGRFLRMAAGVVGAAFAPQLLLNNRAEAVETQTDDTRQSVESYASSQTLTVSEQMTPVLTEEAPAPSIVVNEPHLEPNSETPPEVTDKEETDHWDRGVEWYENFGDPEQSIFMSIGQELATTAAGLGVSIPLHALGLPVGNSSFKELLEDPERLALISGPGQLMYQGAVKAPLYEEVLFRALPSAAINLFGRSKEGYRTTSSQLVGGLVTSAAFAAAHNAGSDKKSIPVVQFMGGMTSWRINRNNGLLHAAVGHGVNNAIALGVSLPSIERKRQAAVRDLEEPPFGVMRRPVRRVNLSPSDLSWIEDRVREQQKKLLRESREPLRPLGQDGPTSEELFDKFFGGHRNPTRKRPNRSGQNDK